MTKRALAVSVFLLTCLTSTEVRAQFTNPIRVHGTMQAVNARAPLGMLDCLNESVRVAVAYAGDGTIFNALETWIGAEAASCMTMTARMPPTPTCWQIVSRTVNGQQSMYNNNDFQIPARYLIDPVGGNCRAPQTSRGTINTNYLSLLVVSSTGTNMVGMSLGVPFDLDPPSTPGDVTAVPGEGSIEVTWRYQSSTTTTDTDASSGTDASATTTATTDLAGFYVLCDPPAGATAGDAGSDAGSDAGLDVPGTVFGDDAGATCGGAFPTIDLYDTAQFARYRRTERTSSNATRAVVSGLSNGGTYRCVVVAEDLAGNRTVSSPTQCVTPVPVTDFWERYRSAGGGARPECAAHPGDGASSRYGAFGVAALVALAARRRRRA